MKPCVYILEIENGNYYIGSTLNVERRLREHRTGSHAGTRYFKNPKLLLVQEYKTVTHARKIERKLKSFKSRKIINKIVQDKKINLNV